MMKLAVCEEMKKLRKWLDENNIEWKDLSTNMPFNNICRTHFTVNGYFFSVIHGYGSYGGWDSFYRDQGLLECMIGNHEPVGWLTAEDIVEQIKDIQRRTKSDFTEME